jgi:hypothetical protein
MPSFLVAVARYEISEENNEQRKRTYTQAMAVTSVEALYAILREKGRKYRFVEVKDRQT